MVFESISFYLRFRLGSFFATRRPGSNLSKITFTRFINFKKNCILLFNRYSEIKSNSNYKILSKKKKKLLKKKEESLAKKNLEHKVKRWKINDNNLYREKNCYLTVTREFIKLIKDYNYLYPKRVVNVGARVDVISSYLAKKFLKIDFVSLDFQNDLKNINSSLPQSPNWYFKSGYILDILDKDFLIDGIIMNMTACKMTPKEFQNFLKISKKKKIKFFILNEPFKPNIFRKNKFFLNSPDDIDMNETAIGSKELLNPSLYTYHYYHNYLKCFTKFGYKVIKSKVEKSNNKFSKGADHTIIAVKF